MEEHEQELYIKRKQRIKDVISSPDYKPMKYRELQYLLQVRPEDRPVFSQILDELQAEGFVEKTQKGKLCKPEKRLLTGVYTANSRGFGFVTVEGEPEDYFIAGKDSANAFHQDTVQIRVVNESTKGGRRKEGVVVKILEHGIRELVGTYEPGTGCGFVTPDNPKIHLDIYIPKALTMGAVRGHKVVVRILSYGSPSQKPEGRVTEILGHISDPGTDILSVARAYELPTAFPEDVLQEAERTPDRLAPEDWKGRLDLRSWQTVTIDGEDAKDLDDAVTIQKKEDGYCLGVHIADVSQYVTEHSALDREALRRGTSVYLIDRVIPMLPQRLSNGICSLNQGEDRLALSCIMELDSRGKVIGHRIAETVIRVDRRMSYRTVNELLEETNPAVAAEYRDFLPMFRQMKELAGLLRERRSKRGSIDFDFPESKILLDASGAPTAIQPYERLEANRIIEDFMLLANETVAEDYFWQELPFLYRIHETPDPERIQSLSVLIAGFGYYFKTNPDGIHPREFQRLLERISGSDEEDMISRLILRSMKQARYSTVCAGHFGLATQYYCHFTSPIRRYPDLQIHRIIKENLHGRLDEDRIRHYEAILPRIAEDTSKLERRADEAEREVEKLKKVQYMSGQIGEICEGVISGMNAWGMYVELPNTVEGLVHVTNMTDDYYYYDEEKYAMIGKDFGRSYRMGQRVTIQVKDTDQLAKTIDFLLAHPDAEQAADEAAAGAETARKHRNHRKAARSGKRTETGNPNPTARTQNRGTIGTAKQNRSGRKPAQGNRRRRAARKYGTDGGGRKEERHGEGKGKPVDRK